MNNYCPRSTEIIFKLIVAAIILISGISFGVGKALAATINVADMNAAIANNGQCSLYEAIENANDNVQTHPDCLAGEAVPVVDEIILPVGTINLPASNPTDLVESTTIIGAGMGQTIIDGNTNQPGLFFCGLPSQPALITIQKFTAKAISDRLLQVRACDLVAQEIEVAESFDAGHGFIASKQWAAGTNSNTVLIEDYYVHDSLDAWGINLESSSGTNNVLNATIRRYTFENNTISGPLENIGNPPTALWVNIGPNGDNITNTINISIENSTFVGNPGNIAILTSANAEAAAGSNTASTINLNARNLSIIDFNGAESRGFLGGGLVGFAGAGAGRISEVNVTLGNTYFINNNSTAGKTTCYKNLESLGGTESITYSSVGYNIVDDATCSFAQPSDRNSVVAGKLNLQPIADNGGLTRTIALGAGSVAIDTADCNLAPADDQRRVARPQGAGCDVGAYETGATVTTTPTPPTSPTLPQVGITTLLATPLTMAVAIMAGYIYWDYRRHRAPLVAESENVQYTLIHHIKYVTIPTIHQRTTRRNS